MICYTFMTVMLWSLPRGQTVAPTDAFAVGLAVTLDPTLHTTSDAVSRPDRAGGIRLSPLSPGQRRLAVLLAIPVILGGAVVLGVKAVQPERTVDLLTALFSPDGHVAHPWPAALRLALAPAILFGTALLCFRVVRSGYGQPWQALLAVAVPLHIVAFFSFPGIFREDGPAEYGSAILALVGAAFFLRAAPKALDLRVAVAILLFFFAMEEISWGQRILGIETEAVLPVANYQNEITLHNFLNPVLDLLAAIVFATCLWVALDGARMPIFGRLPGLTAISGTLIGGGSWCLLPAMTVVAILGVGEVYEELFSLLAFVLGWQTLRRRSGAVG